MEKTISFKEHNTNDGIKEMAQLMRIGGHLRREVYYRGTYAKVSMLDYIDSRGFVKKYIRNLARLL